MEFGRFLQKRERDNKNKLKLLGLILKKAGFKVHPHLDKHQDPHLFLLRPDGLGELVDDLSFDGIRIFMRGKDIVCFRCQMREDSDGVSQPFGESYSLDISGIYRDLMNDDKEKAPYRTIYYIIEEIRSFWIKSGRAEADVSPEDQDGRQGDVAGPTGGSDYANKVTGLHRN